MELSVQIIEMMSRTFLFSFINFIFWLVLLLVFLQYRRLVTMETRLFGMPKNKVSNLTLVSTGYGILGGAVASLLMVAAGISLDQVGILYLWPLAILLMLINPRHMCFAYAGGIVGLVSLFLRPLASYFPQTGFWEGLIGINLPALMALIGILHLTESLLIALSGHLGVSPVYLKNQDGKVVGGFTMQKFWPLPIVGLITFLVPEAANLAGYGVEMPEWWPLFGSSLEAMDGYKGIFVLLPIVAGLGYGDIAISSSPREKSLRSARNLSYYSILLLLLAVGASLVPALLILPVLFAPLGHEYLIMKGNKEEFSRVPLFSPPAMGVMVLDVLPGLPGYRAGLASGDVITRVNGQEIFSRLDLNRCIHSGLEELLLQVEKPDGNNTFYRVQPGPYPRRLGVILVPEAQASAFVELKQSAPWKNMLHKLRALLSRH